ncbi:class I SAM-dependent methyltransferase [Aeromonas simiae]|uniref:Methyltransferase domain-containing protein n=1 Tax=Aeromonas simiae TaxID=218936 RepID=A0A5J6WYU6_9GAMM|nr:class I SAM-dependent methyltransferase [Aeromonas simiae]QFI56296.1 methyltransferase domain-containing protein [Aeromonas simiae]
MASFAEPERLSLVFDSAEREQWQRSSAILARMALPPDAVVADLGAGTGYFTQLLLEQLPKGRVHAIDSEPAMVDYLGRRFAGEGRVSVHQSQPDDPCLPAGVSQLLVANVYRFIAARGPFLAQLHRQMAVDCRGLLVDLHSPQAAVSAEQAAAEVTAAGFVVDELECRTCPHHYLLAFHRP